MQGTAVTAATRCDICSGPTNDYGYCAMGCDNTVAVRDVIRVSEEKAKERDEKAAAFLGQPYTGDVSKLPAIQGGRAVSRDDLLGMRPRLVSALEVDEPCARCGVEIKALAPKLYTHAENQPDVNRAGPFCSERCAQGKIDDEVLEARQRNLQRWQRLIAWIIVCMIVAIVWVAWGTR